MTVLYDKIAYNRRALLDLPFREGVGIVTRDVAKPHHPITLVNTPAWAALVSGKMALSLGGWGVDDYAQCLNADSLDLDFMAGDFSVGGWFNWSTAGIEFSQIIIARYELSVGGWEVYLTEAAGIFYLTLRHHHAGGATNRTAAYSVGWNTGALTHFGISRFGTTAQMYRNGVAVTTISDALIDPETSTQDLVIGTRFTKGENFLKSPLPRLFIAGEALTAEDWLNMYKNQQGYR